MDLPGADLVARGLEDLSHQRETVEAALVSVGRPRLEGSGLPVPNALDDPEERLYVLLEREHGDGTHSAYNALIRRLVSFECAFSREARLRSEESEAEPRASPRGAEESQDCGRDAF